MSNLYTPAIVFPYYYGFKIRDYGAALLWFGHLDCITMPWCSPNPIKAFAQIAIRAEERQLPLVNLFKITGNAFESSSITIEAESNNLKEFGNRITRIAAVGAGGQDHYRKIREYLNTAIELAFTLLDDPELLRVAACQLIWRCYEYHLEMSNNDDVLDMLLYEETIRQGKSQLLAECLVNHYLSFNRPISGFVVENQTTLEFLAKLGQGFKEKVDNSKFTGLSTFQRNYLASTIFENTLSHLCPPIVNQTSALYLGILEDKKDVIEAAKRKCYLAADKLLENYNKPNLFKTLLDQIISDMKSEVQEITEIDKTSWDTFIGQLLEDRVLWAGTAGFLGSVTGALPPVTLAASLLTLFTTVATKGIFTIRQKKQILQKSDWCFIYELNKRRIPFASMRQ